MDAKQYLLEVRALTKSKSIYAAAKLLRLPQQTVRNWHLGPSLPDALGCLRIAEVLDLPWELVMADIEAEREKNPERRRIWEELAKKLKCSVQVVGFTAIGNTTGSEHSAHTFARAEQSTNYTTTKLRPRAPRRMAARAKPARCVRRTRATTAHNWGLACNGHTRAAAAASPCAAPHALRAAKTATR